jgi:hypothetical protein
VIAQGGSLRVYRSSEMAGDASSVDPQAMLDEVFPAIAYFQDTFEASPDRARITGFGARSAIVRQALSAELKCPIAPLAESAVALTLNSSAKDLLNQDLDGLVGWALNGGA